MSSGSKKSEECNERQIGFGELDKGYDTVYTSVFADYHPFIKVVCFYFINVIELELKCYTNVIKGVLSTVINQCINDM